MSGNDSDNKKRVTRRMVLSSTAAAVGVGLAGCAGGGDSTTTTTEETTATETTTTTEETTTTETVSLEEPVAVTEDDRCVVCNMMPAKYGDWNAQLSLDVDGGTRAHFCSPGCLTAFYAKPDKFVDGASQDAIVAAWARDYNAKELVDATSANWVLELDADRIDAPMMRNPLPFASEEDALVYVDQYDDLSKHDVVGLSTFDVPLASWFRAKFLPETDEPSVLDAADVPEGEECAVCQMMPAKYPEANGQTTHEDGERAYFCSPGCATAYYATPGHFNEGYTQDDIVSLWVHDYGTKKLVDGIHADYVLEMKGDRVDLPMMRNPVPYAKTEDALAYVDQYDDLSKHDVVGVAAFDLPLARKYRGKVLPETDEPSVLDPAEVSDDEECAVCQMMPAKYPEANAQLSFEDGERAHFCSPGCLTSYYGVPSHFDEGRSQDDVVAVWAHDYGTKELVDGVRASYVLEMKGDRVDLPMMKNPLPYAAKTDAQAYVDQYDDLAGEDVVTLFAFDEELAKTYRGKFF